MGLTSVLDSHLPGVGISDTALESAAQPPPRSRRVAWTSATLGRRVRPRRERRICRPQLHGLPRGTGASQSGLIPTLAGMEFGGHLQLDDFRSGKWLPVAERLLRRCCRRTPSMWQLISQHAANGLPPVRDSYPDQVIR